MKAIVVGGTGTVGREVARRLRDAGADVRVLTRAPARAAPTSAGIVAVAGDLAVPDTLTSGFAGVELAFVATPLSRTETAEGVAAVQAARAGGARRLVLMTVARIEECLHVPHFASKLPIERELRESGLEFTILRPNNFFQNDLALRRAVGELGVYPQPLGGVGVSRIDVRDIADAATNALLGDGHLGETYTLSGPDELTGEETARAYARHLGRPVVYGGDDLDAWARRVGGVLPPWLVHDLRLMYEHFVAHGLLASDAELAAARRVVGHAPRTFEAFVAEAVASWRA